MKKCSVGVVVAIATALYGNVVDKGKIEGYVRFGLENQDQRGNISDIALGGLLKYSTFVIPDFSAGIGFYTVQGQGKRDNVGIPFYDNDNQNYSLLGELYLEGAFANTTIVLGRQVFDTPFADSDDVGMVPNLFEAYTLTNRDLQDTTLIFSHITKMAGVDAPNASKFTKVNGSDGVQVAGALYEGLTNITLSGWYYHANDLADMVYLEGDYEGKYSAGSYQLGLQYALQNYDNGDKANIYGVMAEISYEASGLGLRGAYNKINSKGTAAANNFLGGGPFFTSDEHLTLAEAGVDGKAYMAGLTYDAGNIGMEGMTLSVQSLHLKGVSSKAGEVDIVMNYTPKERFTLDVIYSDAKNRIDSAESFKNLRVFANYRF